jgi:hypothetical protein
MASPVGPAYLQPVLPQLATFRIMILRLNASLKQYAYVRNRIGNVAMSPVEYLKRSACLL